MVALLQRIAEGDVLVSDGAMGTLLHSRGLGPGECPESWCESHPEVVREIGQAYCAAGAEIIGTNSFGGSSLKLKHYGLAGKARGLNRAAAALARAAIQTRGFVAGSIGPTGYFAREEHGKIAKEEMYDSFREQAVALAEGGADAICVETMASLVEAAQAIRAARENTALPVICTFTFESRKRGFFTIMGVTPARAAESSLAAGADIIGANCGNGIADMIEIARQMRAAAPRAPILIHANAGLPQIEDGRTVFKETPESMAARVAELIHAGANIIGGCCGTGPAHIAAVASAVRAAKNPL